jgi:Flp pilus assembly protein TadD
MARAAVKAKQAQRAKAQPAKAAPRRGRGRRAHAGGGNPNQQLFFVRMRRSAKPAYLVLAILFAATFAFLGVGSGSSGLDQLFSNLNIFHHSGTSLSNALKEVQKHPNDPQGFRDLATAYESKNDTANAISALVQYTTLRPKAAKVWSELGGLQLAQGQSYTSQLQGVYTNAQLAAPGTALAPAGKLATALGTNPIDQAETSRATTALSDLSQRVQLAYQGAISSYRRVTALEPGDANAQFQLANAAYTAYSAGVTSEGPVAAGAFKAYLKLNPNTTSAGQIKQLIKQLSG